MIKTSKYATIIYIDHETNPTIMSKTKFSITNIDKLNLKLIRVLTYFSQFRFDVKHRSEKFNIIFDAFNRLSSKTRSKKENLNINIKNPESDQVYAYAVTLIEISEDFRKILINDYVKNPA